MSGGFMLHNAQTINEDEALVNGFDAACGPTAAYIAAGIVDDFPLTQGGLQQLVAEAERAGTLNTGGQLFSTGPQWDLAQYNIGSSVGGVASASQLQNTLDSALSQNKPVVLGLNNANQLTGESPGLHGHFVTAVGKNANNDFIISDPNLGRFTDNSVGQLFAAQPVSLTTPNKSASGTPVGVSPGTLVNTGAQGFSLFSVQLPDLTKDIETVIHDIFPITAKPDWAFNITTRLTFGALGVLVFIVSLDYFLGTFHPATPNQGPLQRLIRGNIQRARNAENALKEKGEEIAGVAGKAAVI